MTRAWSSTYIKYQLPYPSILNTDVAATEAIAAGVSKTLRLRLRRDVDTYNQLRWLLFLDMREYKAS